MTLIDYIIQPEQKLILIWFRGETSSNETIEQIKALRADPQYSNNFDSIADISELKTDFSRQDIMQMAQFSETLPQGDKTTKNAIIAPSDRTFGTSRMFEQLTNGFTPFKTAVFRDLESALKWIGKNPEAIMNFLKAS